MATTLGFGTSEEFFFDEYQTLDLRDRRLDERARKIFVQLQNKLGSCIRRVFVEAKDARQAYDFFSNPKVSGSKLIEPHYQENIKRINASDAKYILVIQDQMRLIFTNHFAKTEIGRIGKSQKTDQYGLIQHTALCVTDTNEPLGIIDFIALTWAI